MNIEKLRNICLALPGVTEDIKWENHLCFLIGDKMFVVLGMDEVPVTASIKVSDDDFEKLSNKKGFKPAPYLARYKWIFLEDIDLMSEKEWKQKLEKAYELKQASQSSSEKIKIALWNSWFSASK